MIKVSIIVPIYNVEKLLKRCLDSLVNQTLKDIEIICINDGSTDNSLEILKSFANKDKRIVIIDKQNEGLCIARNTGMKIAQGEYIGFVDSDDWVDLDFYEKLYNSAVNNNADIAVSEIYEVHWNREFYKQKFEKEKCIENIEEKFYTLNIPEYSYIWNKIYKRTEIEKYNIQFIPNLYYEDRVFTPEVLYALKRVVIVPNVRYYYFRHKNSIVRNKNINRTKADEIMTKFFQEHNLNLNKFIVQEKKYKIFGITFLKRFKKGNKISYRFLNCIKWSL